ncbi:prolyl oligopeptidase family serine peptidase [Streptomyces sp. NPDC001020]
MARARLRLDFPSAADGLVWWQEVRPEEGGRTTVVVRTPAGEHRTLLESPWDARTRVHEYGGRSYLPVRAPTGGDWQVVFSHCPDQRLYLTQREGPPQPLTPSPATPGTLRYADFALSADGLEVWCVRECHSAGGDISRSIVTVPLDGSGAQAPEAIREVVTGADFFAFPTPSPDGRQLAWICWNHPHMPWDASELRVGSAREGSPIVGRTVMGGGAESVLAPWWRDEATLYTVSDRSGWWNLYEVDPVRGQPHNLHPLEEEFAAPLWDLGGRPFVPVGDGRLAVVHGRGDQQLSLLDPRTGELSDIDCGYPVFSPVLSSDRNSLVGLAGGPDRPPSIVRVDALTGAVEEVRCELDDTPPPAYLPTPRAAEFTNLSGDVVHALVYPPSHPDVCAPDNERPPYIVWVHGGPTGHDPGMLDLSKAYFTSRGIGVVAVNYGGSSGYGRAYRERLKGMWGVVDVADVSVVARRLAEHGEADGQRLAIRGPSAGGWTALAAVTTGVATHGPVFQAATSYFGVADLERLALHLHDFESHYLDGLVGPLPECAERYRRRSPIGHAGKTTCPVLLLQGEEDPIVPLPQAKVFSDELTAHGVDHALLTFPGESHGFRMAATMVAALQAELAFYGRALGFTPPDVPPLDDASGA